ncbi:MFS transporter [Arthrobacter sp. GCM10027362]|uniref:MFS transporter n=1 Tax=Arthrobacter sp. GCM10027362 TaxID=3273379 RepID=UPI003634F95E
MARHRHGRKPVLVGGWLFAVPVPPMLVLAPDWHWVIAANVLLGISQGLTWSTAVVMKIDPVGPRQRGLAMGLNEAAGYGAVAVSSLLAGYLAGQYGLRPAPFLPGLFYTVLALLLSGAFVRETAGHARLESRAHTPGTDGTHDHLPKDLPNRQILMQTTLREPALSSASLAGLVNNLNFGLSRGLFPLLFTTAGLPVAQVGLLFALYPGVWGAGQLVTGALSDRIGRRQLITAGMGLQAAALAVMAASSGFTGWAAGTVLLGAGTAMAYPTLLAVVGDVAHPAWRARAVGISRVWRDLGYAAGAVLGGVIADSPGLHAAVWSAAAISAAAVASRMHETLPPRCG